MTDLESSSKEILLDKEINRLVCLCSQITQMATNIRSIRLTNLSHSSENIETLLSIAENVEGSAILLESLIATQQPSMRFSYSRKKLLELKNNVSSHLSKQIESKLREVVERESNEFVDNERKSWRDIRTILM